MAVVLGGLIASGLLLASGRRRALDVAHEVRRPLTALLLTAESLRSHLRDGELDALLREVQRASDKLEDLDWLSSLTRQVLRAERRPKLTVSELTKDVALAWEPVARSQGRRISVEVAGAKGVSCDGERLGRALSGLISNSLEHGLGDVDVQASRRGEACVISVANASGSRGNEEAWGRGTVGSGVNTGSQRRGRGMRIAAFEARRLGGLLRGWDATRGTAELELAGGERP